MNRIFYSPNLILKLLNIFQPETPVLFRLYIDNYAIFRWSWWTDEEEKEREHSSVQDQLDKQLQELDKRLQQREAEMKQFAKSDTPVLKQHFDK